MPTDRTLIKREVETYAKVLLEAANGEKKVHDIEAQLDDAQSIIIGNSEFRGALEDKTIDGAVRADLVRKVFKDADASLVAVLALMVERDDIRLLPRVREDYIALAEEETKVVVVDVTTVVALTDELRAALKKKLSAGFGGKDVLLREHLDKSIMGGIVMSAHGKRIDASIQSQLEQARVVLSTVSGGEC